MANRRELILNEFEIPVEGSEHLCNHIVQFGVRVGLPLVGLEEAFNLCSRDSPDVLAVKAIEYVCDASFHHGGAIQVLNRLGEVFILK